MGDALFRKPSVSSRNPDRRSIYSMSIPIRNHEYHPVFFSLDSSRALYVGSAFPPTSRQPTVDTFRLQIFVMANNIYQVFVMSINV